MVLSVYEKRGKTKNEYEQIYEIRCKKMKKDNKITREYRFLFIFYYHNYCCACVSVRKYLCMYCTRSTNIYGDCDRSAQIYIRSCSRLYFFLSSFFHFFLPQVLSFSARFSQSRGLFLSLSHSVSLFKCVPY